MLIYSLILDTFILLWSGRISVNHYVLLLNLPAHETNSSASHANRTLFSKQICAFRL
jgi:hypothetical protein